MLSYLLLFRFLLFNVLCVGLVATLHSRGVVLPLFAQDTTYISHGIVFLFAVSWAALWRLVWRTSRQLNANKDRPLVAHSEDRTKAFGKIEWLKKMPEWLATLGLLGTVVGFSMALSGVGDVTNAAAIKGMVGSMLGGMRIAINTTIVGVVLGLWTEVNVRMLFTATGTYWSDRVLRRG